MAYAGSYDSMSHLSFSNLIEYPQIAQSQPPDVEETIEFSSYISKITCLVKEDIFSKSCMSHASLKTNRKARTMPPVCLKIYFVPSYLPSYFQMSHRDDVQREWYRRFCVFLCISFLSTMTHNYIVLKIKQKCFTSIMFCSAFWLPALFNLGRYIFLLT